MNFGERFKGRTNLLNKDGIISTITVTSSPVKKTSHYYQDNYDSNFSHHFTLSHGKNEELINSVSKHKKYKSLDKNDISKKKLENITDIPLYDFKIDSFRTINATALNSNSKEKMSKISHFDFKTINDHENRRNANFNYSLQKTINNEHLNGAFTPSLKKSALLDSNTRISHDESDLNRLHLMHYLQKQHDVIVKYRQNGNERYSQLLSYPERGNQVPSTAIRSMMANPTKEELELSQQFKKLRKYL